MKKSIFIWMGAMLMMTIGMCSCSDDDNDVVNPEEEEEIVQKDFFYYHMGDKIPLTLNVNNYCINIPKDNDKIRERDGYEGLVIDARSGRALYRTSYDW